MRTHHISITTNVYGTHLFGVFAYKESSTIKVLSDILLICKNCTYNKKLVWSSFWCWIPHLQFFSFTSLIVPTLFPLSHCCHHYHIVTLPYHCNIIVVVKSLLQHCRNIVPKKNSDIFESQGISKYSHKDLLTKRMVDIVATSCTL